MQNRILAIINENEDLIDNVKKTLAFNAENSSIFKTVFIFSKFKDNFDFSDENLDYHTVHIPENLDTSPKIKNYVIKYFKDIDFKGKLHILEDKVRLLKDPSIFINDIENMMDVLDLRTWCGTETDKCNYVYNKFNPRLNILIDNNKYNSLNIKNILFCSHSNVQWMIFDLSKAIDNELYFNESFTIDMFFIIEYLARRRNLNKDSLYFMNQYITCSSEHLVYDMIESQNKDKQEDIQEKMKNEDIIFKQMNIDYSPTNDVDMVLERLYAKLNSKI